MVGRPWNAQEGRPVREDEGDDEVLEEAIEGVRDGLVEWVLKMRP
jgi:hypothetical protein